MVKDKNLSSSNLILKRDNMIANIGKIAKYFLVL